MSLTETNCIKGFSFKQVTFIEVRDCINNFKNKRSRDIYGLNIELIKMVKNILITPLTKLFNLCISMNSFPDCLKKSLIIPIFKKGDANDKNNYRPVSLLPIFSKIFEKLMMLQISNYLVENKILVSNQFGFRKKIPTFNAILTLVNNIVICFEENKYYEAYFLDLSKAFDTVCDDILIKKLQYYKFSVNSINLTESYLNHRTQRVRKN
jgi:hypothetical protein